MRVDARERVAQEQINLFFQLSGGECADSRAGRRDAVGKTGGRGNRLAQLNQNNLPFTVRARVERRLLGVRERRHEAQVIPNRMAFAQVAKSCGTGGKDTGGIGEPDARDGALREGFNLSGVENSLHASLSRETRRDGASRPTPVSRCRGSWLGSSP